MRVQSYILNLGLKTMITFHGLLSTWLWTQIHPYNPATGFKLYGYEQTRERIVEETATSRDTLEKDVQS